MTVKVFFFRPAGAVGLLARILGALSPFHPWRTRYSHVAVESNGFTFSMNFDGFHLYWSPDDLVELGAGPYDTIELEGLDEYDTFLKLMQLDDFPPEFDWLTLLELWFDTHQRRKRRGFICTDVVRYALDWPTRSVYTPDKLYDMLDSWHETQR